jgi:hypothetical protein
LQITSPLNEIAHLIQLAIAPVFLLTAVATILSVLTGRLARAVDRRRSLMARMSGLADDLAELARREIEFEVRRTRLIYLAITSAVICALLVAALISLAFIDAFVSSELGKLIAFMFILAMFALMTSLSFFLREIFLSVNSPRAPLA